MVTFQSKIDKVILIVPSPTHCTLCVCVCVFKILSNAYIDIYNECTCSYASAHKGRGLTG